MFGICYYNIVPVRTNPSNKEELCTQLLFGDTYQVIEENENWLKIQISYDKYEGWIDTKLHTEIQETDFEAIRLHQQEVTHEILGALLPLKVVVTTRRSRGTGDPKRIGLP